MALLTAARGLQTHASEITRPDGALVIADNVVIDADNTIQKRRGFSEFGNIIPSSQFAKQVLTYKGRILRHYSNKLAFDSNGLGSFSIFSGDYSELISGLRIKYVEFNGNLYFTTATGIKKISATAASDFTTATSYITDAGGAKATDIEASLIFDEAGFLPPQSKVAYRVVWGTRDANNNLILGSPSARYVLTNNSETVESSEKFDVTVSNYIGITDSEYFFFYTLNSSYFVWFDVSGTAIQPSTADTLGKTAIKVEITGLSSNASVAAKIANDISSSVSEVTVELNGSIITVTMNEAGNVTDVGQGTVASTDVLIAKTFEGSIVEGLSANASVNINVPQNITTNYFYQVYRTAVSTVVTGLTINDLDPGDEMQLVFEAPITSAEITAGEVTIEDITPESFRQSGDFLYTNSQNANGGILQANERPPIATDIAVFRNSVFYANTKDVHRKEFSILSVDDFVSGTTKLFVGNSDSVCEYTFVGVPEITDIDVLAKSETVGSSYITINSANNERKYYIWFDKGTISKTFNSTTDVNAGTDQITITSHGFATNDKIQLTGTPPSGVTVSTDYYVIRVNANTIQLSLTVNGSAINIGTAVGSCTITHTSVDPVVTERSGIRIPFELYGDSLTESKTALTETLLNITDFSTDDFDSNTVRITATNNGNVDTPTLSTPNPGWTFSIFQQGDGEDELANEVFLSGSASVAIAIDETARSLVKIINRDANCPINAFYLSGANDLPGKILFESRSLEDNKFFIAISDTSLSAEFNPEFPNKLNLDSINSTTNIFTTTTSHGYSPGDKVYIHDNPGASPTEFGGEYTIATIPGATTFTLVGVDVLTNQPGPLSAVVYESTVYSDNNISANRIYYSKVGQPEAVPIVNYIEIGPKDREIQRIIALRDNLFVLKEDGVYIVTGPSAPNFEVRLLDNSSNIIAPDSAVVLNNVIYMLSTQGIVTVSDGGVAVISRGIENLISKVTTFAYTFKYTSFGISYESDRSYLLWLPETKTDTVATQCFRYNTFTRTWTRWLKSNTCGVVNPEDDRMYLGSADRNYIEQERKDFERQDYADRDFTLAFPANAINDTIFSVSTAVDLEVGDVITQEQYMSIPKFNRLLKKLDRDTSSELSNNYFSTLEAEAGDNLANKLLSLAAKLNTDLTYTIPTPTNTNTLIALRDDYNAIINALNNVSSGTGYKDYKLLEDLLTYEVLIQDVDSVNNKVTVNFTTWFTERDFQVYKAIKSEIQWAPQHFGKPEIFKQVREGTFIFDQNNFYGGTVGYSSDRSQDFVEYPFTGRTPGFWVCYNWANTVWGGSGNDVPVRTLIPANKQRCRYINIKFKHENAREQFNLIGVSLEPREMSTRGYR